MWIYQTISQFHKILNDSKQSPMIKFNTLLAIKICFNSFQYVIMTLIQVYLLDKIRQIALFKSKIKDQSSLTSFFNTQGYLQKQHKNLKTISFNYVMLAIQFIFAAASIKKCRTVEDVQINQKSRYTMSANYLEEKRIKCPEKFSYFIPDFAQEGRQKYLQKIQMFIQSGSDQYTQYFLTLIITQFQNGKKRPLQVKHLLSYGDSFLTSAMINMCEDELSSLPEGIETKRKYLQLFHQFIRWGDIQAVLMLNNSQFITKIAVNICSVRGDININQGQNIYPQILQKKLEKKNFYIDFLRCLETWAESIPLNQQGLESNVRKIYIFLKEEKKFKFPENLILKRYKKELEDNLKINEERNQKLLELMNDYEQTESALSKNVRSSMLKSNKKILTRESMLQQKKDTSEKISMSFLENKVNDITRQLQNLIETKQSPQIFSKKYQKLKQFKQKFNQWLDNLEVDEDMKDQQQEDFEELIVNGDECLEAIDIISPLCEMYISKSISYEQLIKRIQQNLLGHQDLSASRSKQLQLSRSDVGRNQYDNAISKNLTNTLQKSKMNRSRQSKLGAMNTSNKYSITNNPKKKSQILRNLYSSRQSLVSSTLRKSKMNSKITKIRQSFHQKQTQSITNTDKKVIGSVENFSIKSQPFQVNQSNHFRQQYFDKSSKQQLVYHLPIRQDQGQLTPNQSKAREKSGISNKQSDIKSRSLKSENGQFVLNSSSGHSKNITIVSRKAQQGLQMSEQQIKQVVVDMDLMAASANNIVVEYSDIEDNQFQKKSQEREIMQKKKIQLKRKQSQQPTSQKQLSFSKQSSKFSRQQSKTQQQIKTLKIIPATNSPSQNDKRDEQSSKRDRLNKKLLPFNQDYGGKNAKITKIQGQKARQQALQKTKKSDSRISVSSQSNRSSLSIRQKIKSRINQKKSLIKEYSDYSKSLQSEIRQLKELEVRSISNDSHNSNKRGIKVTQFSRTSRLNAKQQYNGYISKPSDLLQTKKVNQIHDVPQRRPAKLNRKAEFDSLKPDEASSKSSRLSRFRKSGISLSLGKNRSSQFLKTQPSGAVKPVDLAQPVRGQYFTLNSQIKKPSNREKIMQKIDNSEDRDVIRSPNHQPLVDSQWQIESLDKQRLDFKGTDFKNCIQEVNRDVICPRSKQVQQIIKYGWRRPQLRNFIQNNPNSSRAKSQQKNLLDSRLKEYEMSRLQQKLKALQTHSRNQKTKLVVRDHALKSYQNSEKGQTEFNSRNNSYLGSNGIYKISRVTSEKALISSPIVHQFNKSSLEGGQIQLVKSSDYKQYFQVLKSNGTTFRKSVLKAKGLLQKLQQIQIGCLSVRKEDDSLDVVIFITPLKFDLTEVTFNIIHDQNISSSPHKIINHIQLKQQAKVNLKLKVINIPFGICEIEVNYKSKLEYLNKFMKFPLPILFNKFCSIEPVFEADLGEKFMVSQKKMITSEFKMNPKIFKFQKAKEILPNFTEIVHSNDLYIYGAEGRYGSSSFYILLKVNERNLHTTFEGILKSKNEDLKPLEFLLITLKNIFETDK